MAVCDVVVVAPCVVVAVMGAITVGAAAKGAGELAKVTTPVLACGAAWVVCGCEFCNTITQLRTQNLRIM